MQLKLQVLEGSQQGTEIPVPGPKFFIGRDKDCQLRPNSDLISRHHCVVIVESTYVAVRDFNSRNGTFVNGEKVVGERELKAGDELSVGPLRFGIRLDVAVGGQKREKVKDVKEAVARTVEMVGDDELDISKWLDDEESGIAKRTTKTIDMDPVSDIGVGSQPPATDTTEIDVKAAETSADPKKKKPGKLPEKFRLEEKSENTQSAAMNTLRKLRQMKKS